MKWEIYFFLEDTDILGESLLKSGFQIHFSSVSLVSYGRL